MLEYYIHNQEFAFESGEKLDHLKIAYQIIGNPEAKKLIWVCHALSGNTDVLDWWGGLFGINRLFDPSEYKIVCANVLGSCYGSTGPDDFEEGSVFPLVTIRDMVNAHEVLRKVLGIERVDVLIGASLGGQQALEWSIQNPEFSDHLILIATNAVHSPYGRGFNEAQRMALKADPTFGQENGGKQGLAAARAIAMLSYRSYNDFSIKQADTEGRINDFNASSYLNYQGSKFIERFQAKSYYVLSKSMDSHDVGRERGGVEKALKLISAKTLVVAVDSDVLFPQLEQKRLVEGIPDAVLGFIKSPYGHDAFLIEYEQLSGIIKDFLYNDFKINKPTVVKTTLKNVR
ncbi:homoserine O-acetyltransferase [Paracrocinitomix mangrovi]|uniref:homoserine O-acetyltransferase family protein n=1 Tax=Paracrocinitomix mangrovi TaxID=2862509 RepID=UPI001C8CF8DD|nr:homoserine O-acetyltransferase [Paracrocinitomix mangrovi]UKN02195.1 homoserine O-acetyltransferase [Paracrocinitomix mangrovi]